MDDTANIPDDGGTNGGTAPERSIFDLGSVATGDERPTDTTVTGDASANDRSFDPASLSGTSDDSGDSDAPYGRTPTGRIRRRPVGSGTRNTSGESRRGTASQATLSLNNILFSAHIMLSAFLNVPQLQLEEEESKKLAEATTRVTEMYDVKVLSPEALAWINLAMVAGGIYGPRLVSYNIDRKAKRGPRPVQRTQPTPFVAPVYQPDAAVM